MPFSSHTMRDDLAEILFQSFLQETRVISSAMGRDVHSLMLSIQHFLCDHDVAHPPWCPEGWLWRGCRGVWHVRTMQVFLSWQMPEELPVDPQGRWSCSASSRWSSVVSILPCMLRLLPGISLVLISTLAVYSPAFFQNLSWFFSVLAVVNTSSCVGPQNKIGNPVGCTFSCWVPTEYK